LSTWPVMDELDRLVDVYRARGSSSVKSRLDVLMDLERIRAPRVLLFTCYDTRCLLVTN